MTHPVCSWHNCSKPSKNKSGGLCGMHRERQRAGSPPMDAPAAQYNLPIEQRYTVTESGCWEWNSLNRSGYGQLNIKGYERLAHRFMWVRLVGPIPEGKVLDHLCRNRACVNPDHLEVVTTRINNRRGMAPNFAAWRQNQCRRGHRFTPENTLIEKSGSRRCRRCHALRQMERYYRLRDKGATA